MVSPVRPGDPGEKHRDMQIAILLFDGFASLDAVSLHDTLSRLPEAEATFIGETVGPVRDESRRVELTADAALHELPRPHIIALPGGVGAALFRENGTLHRWLRNAAADAGLFMSVSHGSLIAASAGLLSGRTVAAPPVLRDELAGLGVVAVDQAIAIDDRFVTMADASAIALFTPTTAFAKGLLQ